MPQLLQKLKIWLGSLALLVDYFSPNYCDMIYQVWNHHIDSWSVPNVLNTENCNNEQDSLQPIYYVVDLLKYDIFHINMMKRRHCDAGLSNGDWVRLRRRYHVLSKAIMCKTYVANVLSIVFLMFVHSRLSYGLHVCSIWQTGSWNWQGLKEEIVKKEGKQCFFPGSCFLWVDRWMWE